MYGHKVIESLEEIIKISSDKIIITNMKRICYGIKQAQHFHFGNYQELAKYFKNKISDEDTLFMESRGEHIKLPYDSCWFDFNVSDDGSAKKDGLIHIFRRGILVNGSNSGKSLIANVLSEYPAGSNDFIPNKNTWILSPFSYFVSIGEYLSECSEFPFADFLDHKSLKKGNTFPIPNSSYADHLMRNNPEAVKNLIKEDSIDMRALNMAMMFLSCKNIGTVNNHPQKALNQKRKKNKKQELFTYKTLVLNPVGKKQCSIPKHLWDNRIHLCRGHFKTYSKENPLMGKFTGRFWWQPQIRGNKDNGIVEKDYSVEVG